MKFYKKRVNGKEYLYAVDSIFIARGKTIKKFKSFGPADTVKNMAFKKQNFYDFLLKDEIFERVKYWRSKITNSKFTKRVSVSKIENLRARLYRAKKSMGELGNAAMNGAFLVDFIYNSNKIEGSKLPRESVQRIVNEQSKKNDEVNNTIQAINYLQNKFRFTSKSIERLHAVLLAHEPTKLGLRKEKIVVGNSNVSAWEDIRVEMKKLIRWYEINKKTMYPPELAFIFYYRFERIHPFLDGNGRTGRLIMNEILRNNKYHPIIIWDKRRLAHFTSFEKYMEGREEYFFDFIAEQFMKTHEIYLKKIDEAFNLDKQMGHFLKPSEY